MMVDAKVCIDVRYTHFRSTVCSYCFLYCDWVFLHVFQRVTCALPAMRHISLNKSLSFSTQKTADVELILFCWDGRSKGCFLIVFVLMQEAFVQSPRWFPSVYVLLGGTD